MPLVNYEINYSYLPNSSLKTVEDSSENHIIKKKLFNKIW
jgi:hypothetical protein